MVEISLKCVFCKNNLTYDIKNPPKHGDMIKCQNCGKMNDFDATLKIAKDEGREKLKEEAIELIKKKLHKSFKNSKIKLKLK